MMKLSYWLGLRTKLPSFTRVKCAMEMPCNVELAIGSGDKEAAKVAFEAAQPEVHRGVTKGVLHRNTAARKLPRLSGRIKAMA